MNLERASRALPLSLWFTIAHIFACPAPWSHVLHTCPWYEADAGGDPRAISAAKIKIADAARHVSQEAVQLHGGMGMTEELKISHAFRRLTVLAREFGDADHHLARFAAL